MELKFVELMETARIIVEDCMKLKPGNEALVVTDTRATDYCGVEALLYAVIGAIKAAGVEPVVISYTAKVSNGDELPRAVAEAMKNTDAIIALTTKSILHTTAAAEARAAGVRTLMLPAGSGVGFTNDYIYRVMPKSIKEIEGIADLTNRIGSLFKNGHTVKITTKKGTDLTLNVGQLGMSFNNGYCDKPGVMQFVPSGQLAIGVNPGSANGKLVSDVSMSRVSAPLSEPITFMIKDGYVTSITGGKEAVEFEKIIKSQNDPDAYLICEVGLGMNPKAKPGCDTLENEHIYGGGHIGFGSNATFAGGKVQCANNWHVDTCFLEATMWVDGQKIVEDGVYLV